MTRKATPLKDSSERVEIEPLEAEAESSGLELRAEASADGTAEAMMASSEMVLRVLLAMGGGPMR